MSVPVSGLPHMPPSMSLLSTTFSKPFLLSYSLNINHVDHNEGNCYSGERAGGNRQCEEALYAARLRHGQDGRFGPESKQV